jgi:hypothetical protein
VPDAIRPNFLRGRAESAHQSLKNGAFDGRREI